MEPKAELDRGTLRFEKSGDFRRSPETLGTEMNTQLFKIPVKHMFGKETTSIFNTIIALIHLRGTAVA